LKELISGDKKEKFKYLIQKEITFVLILPLLLSIVMFYFKNKDISSYCISIDLYYTILAFSMGLISILKKSNDLEEIYIKIGIGFLISSILQYVSIVLNNLNYILLDKRYEVILQLVIFFSNYSIIFLAFNVKSNGDKRKFYYLEFSFIVILCVIFSAFIINTFYYSDIFTAIVSFTLIAFLVITTASVIFQRNSLQKDEKIKLIIYLIFMFIYQGLYIWYYLSNDKMYFLEYLFKYLSICVMYKILEKNLFYKSYEREKNLLEESQIRQKDLNKILSKKNKDLLNLNAIIDENETRQTKLMNNIKDAIVIISFDRISYINKSALQGLKVNEKVENIVGFTTKEVYELLIRKKILNDDILNKIKKSTEQEFEVRKLYKIMKFKLGEVEFEIYYVKFNNADRLIYVKDVTYINESEKLRKSYEEYLKEEKLKDEFYTNISHELRTPINLIFSALQVDDIYINDENIEGIKRNNQTIKQNCLRLIRTINNFIDTNKISEGYIVPNKKIYNIVEIVENVSLACKSYLDKIENTIIFDSEDEEIYSEVDKDMIERIMLNLLSNTVKYGEREATIYVDIMTNNNKVIIKVRNNKYTISQNVKPYLFDKFSKVNKSLSREKEGSGLGLFLTRALLKLLDGTIDVESSNEIGTEFIITLPMSTSKTVIEKYREIEMNSIAAKVDTEFSDIYF
jgi:signal transduction histidine kinase